MSVEAQLFESKLIRPAAIDHEKDQAVDSRWNLIFMGILREEWQVQEHS